MAEKIIQMLNEHNVHYILKRWKKTGQVSSLAYVEPHAFEARTVIRWFYFCDATGQITRCGHDNAPNGGMDLLARFADDVEIYGTDPDAWYVVELH